jgi:signal transduction histidine kinase
MGLSATVKGAGSRLQETARSHPGAADAALAAALAAAALVSVASLYSEIERVDPSLDRPSGVAIVASMLAITVPLAWRRRFPFTVAGVVVAAFLFGRIVVDVPESSISLLAGSLALYSAAVHGRVRVRTAVLSVCLAAILAEVVRELYFIDATEGIEPLAQFFFLAYNAVVLALPWALGAVIRSLRERENELAERAADLQREREENARQAVFAERVRIARELHDVVAHHVSLMGVQAGAARRVMERQPEKAAEALSSIEASSRQAVVELQRLLGFLRRAGEADELAPQPSLAELDDLVALAGQGDLTVHVRIDGDPEPLAPTLEVSAYRVIQEALTNARKHSDGHTATVRLTYSAAALEVEVTDDGTGTPNPFATDHDGHGLIGMRERTALHGGHLRAGPRPGGGFAVHATFPLNGALG